MRKVSTNRSILWSKSRSELNKKVDQKRHVLFTEGCFFSREKAVKDVESCVRFCFLVGVYLDLDWSRKN